jgi:hypothetical protein
MHARARLVTLLAAAILCACSSPAAALLITFGGSGQTPSDLDVTLTDLDSDPATEVTNPASPINWSGDALAATGTLNDVSSSDSFAFRVSAYEDSDFAAIGLILSSEVDMTKDSLGWGVAGFNHGDAITDRDALLFDFDLSGLPGGWTLELTEVVLDVQGSVSLEVIVLDFGDGEWWWPDYFALHSLSSAGNPIAVPMSVPIADNDGLLFRVFASSDPADDYARLQALNLVAIPGQVIPEPATLSLLRLGALGLLRRRSSSAARR